MAGVSQAVNLTGMLGQMGSSLREGAVVDGKTIGGMYGEQFNRAMAPKVDPNDPASMEKMAAYLERQGKSVEAMRMRERAAQLQREQGAMTRMDGMFSIMDTAGQAAAAGDVSGVNKSISSIGQLASGAQTPEEKRLYYTEANKLRNALPGVQQRQVQNEANVLVQMDGVLEDSRIPEETKAQVRQRRESLLQKPQVAETYQSQLLERAQNEAKMAEIEGQQITQELRPEFTSAWNTEGYADWKEQQVAQGRGEYVANLERYQTQVDIDTERLDKMRQEGAAATADMDVDYLDNLTERLEASSIPTEQQKAMKSRFLALKAEMEEFNSKPPEQRVVGKIGARRAAITKELSGIAAVINNSSYATDSSNTTTYNKLFSELTSVETAISKVSPDPNDVLKIARGYTGLNERDVYSDEASTELLKRLRLSPTKPLTVFDAVYQAEANKRTQSLTQRAAQLRAEISRLGEGSDIDKKVEEFLQGTAAK